MNENPKCIFPQFKKPIYVENIIVQNNLKKIICQGKGPQRNTQNPNASNKSTKTQWRRKLEGNMFKEKSKFASIWNSIKKIWT